MTVEELLLVSTGIFFALNIIQYLRRGEPSVRYVDRSGIQQNPPTFVETWENKTINFEFDGFDVRICHLPILENIQTISKISGNFSILSKGAEAFYKKPLTKKESLKIYQTSYMRIVELIYQLAKPHASKKWGFRRAFFKKAKKDGDFVIVIAKEIFDYWQNMGKLLSGMGRGLTPRLTYGEELYSDNLKWGKDGERLIGPRFAHVWKLLNKRQSKPKTPDNTESKKSESESLSGE